jgi:HdeA/HdeB family
MDVPADYGFDFRYALFKRRTQMRKLLLLATTGIMLAGSNVRAQVPLSSYTDANGFIDVQTLMCSQLAGTFQEDADMLTTWYSGWYNGLAKKHYIHVTRAKLFEHEVIVYCKANPDVKIITAMDMLLKEERHSGAYK